MPAPGAMKEGTTRLTTAAAAATLADTNLRCHSNPAVSIVASTAPQAPTSARSWPDTKPDRAGPSWLACASVQVAPSMASITRTLPTSTHQATDDGRGQQQPQQAITTTTTGQGPHQHGRQERHGEHRGGRLQVICRMPGNLVAPRPERLGDQHRHQEGGHGPPAAKDPKEATGQRPSWSGHLGLLTHSVGRFPFLLNTEPQLAWPMRGRLLARPIGCGSRSEALLRFGLLVSCRLLVWAGGGEAEAGDGPVLHGQDLQLPAVDPNGLALFW